jgi:hypothetical protein
MYIFRMGTNGQCMAMGGQCMAMREQKDAIFSKGPLAANGQLSTFKDNCCMGMHGQHMGMHGHAWAMCGHTWACVGMRGHSWACVGIPGFYAV